MTIPGKLLIAVLAAVTASFVFKFAMQAPFAPLLLSSMLASTLAVLLSHRPLPPPRALRQAGSSASPAGSPRAADAAGPQRETGTVKWFNTTKGFGFVIRPGGEEIFVHYRSLRGSGRRSLRDGQRVSFRVEQTDKGPQAEDVEGLD